MATENAAPLPPPLPPPPHLLPGPSRPDHDGLPAPLPLPPGLTAPSGPGPGPSSGSVAASELVSPPSLPPPYDPSLDPAIKHLLDQQAEIQAKLAALLPQKYGPNVKLELEMLRHKLRVLVAYADEHREEPLFVLFQRSCGSLVPYLTRPRHLSLSCTSSLTKSRVLSSSRPL